MKRIPLKPPQKQTNKQNTPKTKKCNKPNKPNKTQTKPKKSKTNNSPNRKTNGRPSEWHILNYNGLQLLLLVPGDSFFWVIEVLSGLT